MNAYIQKPSVDIECTTMLSMNIMPRNHVLVHQMQFMLVFFVAFIDDKSNYCFIQVISSAFGWKYLESTITGWGLMLFRQNDSSHVIRLSHSHTYIHTIIKCRNKHKHLSSIKCMNNSKLQVFFIYLFTYISMESHKDTAYVYYRSCAA